MDINSEYDSEFANVRYIRDENVVLLTWKKYACLDDYRKPALFASDLLARYPNSNFIVDANNGFEDDKSDVEWGFSVLLPAMAKTTCRYVVFIMNKDTSIDGEIDMWTKEFGKYFTVVKVHDFNQAVFTIHKRILVNVSYIIKPGKADEFLVKVKEAGVISASRAEPGNYQYDYSKPLDSENILYLTEMWADEKALSSHGKTEHYQRLQYIKKDYIDSVIINKYNISEIL